MSDTLVFMCFKKEFFSKYETPEEKRRKNIAVSSSLWMFSTLTYINC